MSKIDTYTHTHLHSSAGSFLDGVGKCEEYMKRAVELGQQAICVTEHGSLASLYEFQKQGDEYGIKTILGNEMYCVERMKKKKGSLPQKLEMQIRRD